MFSEITILNLQLSASICMGYEYFLSDNIKIKVDSWAKKLAQNVQKESDQKIKQQFTVLRRNLRYLLVGILFLTIGIASFRSISIVENDPSYFAIAIIFGFLAVFFILSGINTVMERMIIEGMAPMVVPLGKKVITTYLLFTSKGVIAGTGMLLLLASFWCRYYNATHV